MTGDSYASVGSAPPIELLGIRAVAVLLDEGRDRLVAARDKGEWPDAFVVDPEMLRDLTAMRSTQVARTGMVALFGLRVIAAHQG